MRARESTWFGKQVELSHEIKRGSFNRNAQPHHCATAQYTSKTEIAILKRSYKAKIFLTKRYSTKFLEQV